jgi:chemotaxis protein CheD
MNLIVGMGGMQVSNDPKVMIVTYALGSCIGLTVYDPVSRVGGLLHYMLPESSTNPEKAQSNPFMFADTGIPLFFQEVYQLGGDKRRMQVKMAGGAQLLDDSGYFNIGKRNYMALRKILGANNVLIQAEMVGGQVNRTVRLEVASGRVWVKSSGDGEKNL